MQVDRRKIEEMRLPEKITFTLPPSDASFMKVKAKLIDENSDNEILLETEQLHVPLSLVSNFNQQFFLGPLFASVFYEGSLKIKIRFRKLD